LLICDLSFQNESQVAFEYFELCIPRYSMFNYLPSELLLIKIYLVFFELLNFKLSSQTKQTVGKL